MLPGVISNDLFGGLLWENPERAWLDGNAQRAHGIGDHPRAGQGQVTQGSWTMVRNVCGEPLMGFCRGRMLQEPVYNLKSSSGCALWLGVSRNGSRSGGLVRELFAAVQGRAGGRDGGTCINLKYVMEDKPVGPDGRWTVGGREREESRVMP